MKGKDRAALRSQAHHLNATVHVGVAGLTPAVFGSLEEALAANELVKVQVSRNLDVKPKDAAEALALATGSSIIQVIGRTMTLYRRKASDE
ncbi:MAG TPA: YhbY family RNA-binding protein [Gemmatimonadales bacterium]|nr:YhbY family RNA-binding protein [Gemmatimonadales bacterium]